MAIILTGSTGIATPAVTDANGGNTATINSMTPTADSLQGFRNRIINGDMRIDQRNAGASVTQTTALVYPLDRFVTNGSVTSKFTAQRSTTAPTGFSNSLLFTSSAATTPGSTDYYLFRQAIEGFNTADFAFGSASAKSITMSFWVRCSLTGTFGGNLFNGAVNRCYAFSYTISAANTWEYKTITIAGDTTGTWYTDNTVGLYVDWSLGAGSSTLGTPGSWGTTVLRGPTGQTNLVATNGATFYITGVQLEVGSVATPFERRPYGTELALCQRYYFKTDVGGGRYATGYAASTTTAYVIVPFVCQMRTAPSALEQSGTASNYAINYTNSGTNCSAVPTFTSATVYSATSVFTIGAAALTAGWGIAGTFNANGYLAWSAEL